MEFLLMAYIIGALNSKGINFELSIGVSKTSAKHKFHTFQFVLDFFRIP